MNPQNMTKAEQIKLAANLCWLVSVGLTVNFLRTVLEGSIDHPVIYWGVAIIAALVIQPVLTISETALMDGTLPPPWKVRWSDGGWQPVLVIGALLCLFLDVMMNLGGVAFFFRRFNEQDIGQQELGLTQQVVNALQIFFIIAFSIWFSIGSELLREFARYLETNGPRSLSQHREREPRNNAAAIRQRDEEARIIEAQRRVEAEAKANRIAQQQQRDRMRAQQRQHARVKSEPVEEPESDEAEEAEVKHASPIASMKRLVASGKLSSPADEAKV